MKTWRKIGILVYAFMVVYCLPNLVKWGEGITFSYSMSSVLFFGLVVWLLSKEWKYFWDSKWEDKILVSVISFFFLLALTAGKLIDTKGYLVLSDLSAVMTPIVETPFMAMCLYKLYDVMDRFRYAPYVPMAMNQTTKKKIIMIFFFFLIAWGIVLLGVYPGFFVYDAGDELQEVITRNFTTHHPLFHVLYLGGIVQAGYKIFGNYNAGIFCLMLVQMILFAAGLTFVIIKMREFGFHKKVCIAITLFWGLFPVIPMFVLCSSKDSLFSLMLLLWVVSTYEWIIKPCKSGKVIWLFSTYFLMLLRHNAIYALLVTGFFIIIRWKEQRKHMVLLMMLAIIAAKLTSTGLEIGMQATSTENQEILTVPIQQLTRTYLLDEDAFTEEEEEKLFTYIPQEYLYKYEGKVSDKVKIGFQNAAYEQDKKGFWKLWIKAGIENPVTYINAWLLTSYGYWYPDTINDVYRGNSVYTFTYGDNSYFGFEVEEPGVRHSLIPAVNRFYHDLSLEIYKEKLPVISQLFSPGFIFWVFIFGLSYLWKKNGYGRILPYFLVVIMVGTLLMGPTFLPRYVFYLWLIVPFMIGDMLEHVSKD